MADKPLNPTVASLLGFLHYGPQTGWDLVRTAETLIGDFWSLTRSQVYRELAAMAERGLVKAGPPGRRERRFYTITAAGRAAFAKWVQQEPGPEHIRFPLLLTLTFGRHVPPERLSAFVNHHRQLHADRLETYEAQRRAADEGDQPPDPFALASLEFGLYYERAVLAWFDALPGILGERLDPSAGADA